MNINVILNGCQFLRTTVQAATALAAAYPLAILVVLISVDLQG